MNWFTYFLGFLWALPNTMIGMLMSVFYRPTAVRWSEGCIEFVAGSNSKGETLIFGKPAAQTMGCVIWYEDKEWQEVAWLRVHEREHVRQGFTWGTLFMLAYGAEWLYRFCFKPGDQHKGQPRWFRAYWSLSWEEKARAVEKTGTWGRKEAKKSPWDKL